ncbi:MAG: tetratricopeptide repeat protein [Myxococcales bacterium]|nr:MAG: tetratricopeptide repeat protein [Myxococcales bacterium]
MDRVRSRRARPLGLPGGTPPRLRKSRRRHLRRAQQGPRRGSLLGTGRRLLHDALLREPDPAHAALEPLRPHALGEWPGGYLLTNVALHALATCLLFAALRQMTGRAAPSAFVAAVFAVHPLHVETVAWISERKGVLAGAFWMAGLVAYARYAERPCARRYAAVFACLALGLLSKPVLVSFPLTLLLLDFWPLHRLSRRAVWEKLPMFALVALASGVTLWSQRSFGAMEFAETRDLTLDLRLRNAVDAVVWYGVHSAWPARLTAHYPYAPLELSLGRFLAQAAGLVAATVLLLRAGRRLPALAVGWLWFLVTLAPTLGFVQVGGQARADRYMYVPLVGLLIAVAFPVAAWVASRPRAARVVAVAAAAAVATLAWVATLQVGTWRSSESLYERNLAVEPNSFFGNSALALVRVEQERFDEAEHHFREAFRLSPDNHRRQPLVQFHLLMGSRLAKSGDAAGAIARYESAVALDPDHPDASARLGAALVRRGLHAQALPHLERAIASGEAPAIAYASLAVVWAASGRTADAVREGREAMRRDPELSWAANNLAWILATSPDPALRDPDEAVRFAERAVRRSRERDPDLLDTLAAAYAAAARFDAAIAAAERAVERARLGGQLELAEAIEARLALYRVSQPYREGVQAR